MDGCIKPIGGEFWFEGDLFNKSVNNFKGVNAVFLSGGQSAIRFILEDINFKEDEYVLMPSYLCPTILYNFEKLGIKIIFYKIDKNLCINIKDIRDKLNRYKVRALFFINYFGFYNDNKIVEFLKEIKSNGIILIEDAVQMLWFNKIAKFIGDYIFNSYRKFLPIDGSIVLSNKIVQYKSKKDRYYYLMNEARIKKTAYIKSNIGSEEEFLNIFKEAHEHYYEENDILGMQSSVKEILSIVNYEKIRRTRIENYNYIYDKLTGIQGIRVLFNKKLISDNVPLAIPIIIDNRDYVRKKLMEYKIYCPIHWDIIDEDWVSDFMESRYISKHILSIPIDWRYDKNHMDYAVNYLLKIIANK